MRRRVSNRRYRRNVANQSLILSLAPDVKETLGYLRRMLLDFVASYNIEEHHRLAI